MELKPYRRYKDSGTAWLGEVPSHWEVVPNRGTFTEVDDKNHPDEEMLSVTIGQGVIKQSTLLQDESLKDGSRIDKCNYKLVLPGDIAYNKMRAWQGAIGLSKYRGIISPAYVVQRPTQENVVEFLHYLLRTPAFAKEAERWSYGIASDMWSLRPEHFKAISCCIPPPDEQSAIVRFLDHADEQIQRYVASKERLIRLLEEERQALIHQAVTRGLDPSIRLKPSGVEWLGEIPEGWSLARIKSVARVRYGLGQPPPEKDGGLPLIRATNVSRGHILEHDMLYVDPQEVPQNREAFLSEGEIIVVRSGAYTADSAIIPPQYDGAVTGYDMVLKPTEISPKFLAMALLTSYLRDDQLIINSTRAAQPHLNAEEIGNALVVLPPKEEQTNIAMYLDDRTESLDTAVAQAHRQIVLTNEYRTRLIADVVTGKIDVRNA